MQRFEETVHISGMTPDEVFDHITDPANGPELVSAARSVRAEGEPGEGRTIISKAGFLGAEFETRQTVSAWERPGRYAFGGDQPFPLHFEFRLSEDGDGTRVDGTLETEPGSFFKLGGKMVAKRIGKQFRGDLQRTAERLSR